jgi:hypothetical protein
MMAALAKGFRARGFPQSGATGTIRLSLSREADPATNDAALSLGEQATVEVPRRLSRLQAKALVKHCS